MDPWPLVEALNNLTHYGDPTSQGGVINDVAADPREALMANRYHHGQQTANNYGRLPALAGVLPAAIYEVLKAKALKGDQQAKDIIRYVGLSPAGAAFYGMPTTEADGADLSPHQAADMWANDEDAANNFTINQDTRPASTEAPAAYARGVLSSDAPMIRSDNLLRALSSIFGSRHPQERP